MELNHPNLDSIADHAKEVLEYIEDPSNTLKDKINRIKVIMELYWYRGRDNAK